MGLEFGVTDLEFRVWSLGFTLAVSGLREMKPAYAHQ